MTVWRWGLGVGMGLLTLPAMAASLSGMVTNTLSQAGDVRVLLSLDGGFLDGGFNRGITHRIIPNPDGSYTFNQVDGGQYFLLAFLDRNLDWRLNIDEPVAVYPLPVTVNVGDALTGLDIAMGFAYPTAESRHTDTGFGATFRVRDPLVQLISVSVQGGLLPAPLPMSFDAARNQWLAAADFGVSLPALPQVYTFQMVLTDGSNQTLSDDINDYVLPFVGGISPSGAVYDWIDIAWNPLADQRISYGINLIDLDHGSTPFFEVAGLTKTDSPYSYYGSIPADGTRIQSEILATRYEKPLDGNVSVSGTTFTYMGASNWDTSFGGQGGAMGCFLGTLEFSRGRR